MSRKFPTTCRNCGEDILMVQGRNGKWGPLDFPDQSMSGAWERHYCSVDKIRGKY